MNAPMKTVAPYNAWSGWLWLDGWAGASKQECLVVRETPTRYAVSAARPGESLRLAGRRGRRAITWPAVALVPKYAVTIRAAAPPPAPDACPCETDVDDPGPEHLAACPYRDPNYDSDVGP